MRRIAAALALLLVAAATRAEDAPPSLAAIAAGVRAREDATFPRGLVYEPATPEDADRETVWVDRSACVLRTTRHGMEMVSAWDSKTSVWGARRIVDETWTGTIGRSTTRPPDFDAFCAWFQPHARPLSDHLVEGTSEVIGETFDRGTRCVAVLVRTPLWFLYELDPLRGFAPLRVRVVAQRPGGRDNDDPAEAIVCGRTFSIAMEATAAELVDLGGGAWVPAHIDETMHVRGDRRALRLAGTGHIEHLREGVVGSVLAGAGQLDQPSTGKLLRFDGDEQWEVPERNIFGKKRRPWPGPVWQRPWIVAIEFLLLGALTVFIVRRVVRRAA